MSCRLGYDFEQEEDKRICEGQLRGDFGMHGERVCVQIHWSVETLP